MLESKKLAQGVKTYRLYGQEKFPGAAVNKVGHTDSLLGYESSHHDWFPWKRWDSKQCLLLPTPLAIVHLIYWVTYLVRSVSLL